MIVVMVVIPLAKAVPHTRFSIDDNDTAWLPMENLVLIEL